MEHVAGVKTAAEIGRRAEKTPGYQLTVDLEKCQVKDDQGLSASFNVDESIRHRLLEGLDDIGITLLHEADIAAYEARHS